jgi:AraC-like DNA-binding protein
MPPNDIALSPFPLVAQTASDLRATPLLLGRIAIMAPAPSGAAARANADPAEARCSVSIPLAGRGHVQVVIPAQVIDHAFETLTSAPRAMPLRFDVGADVEAGLGAGVARLLEFILVESDREGVLQQPVVASRLADALVHALLLEVPHNHSHLLRRGRELEPRYVRRVEEYIASNAHCPISVADLADVAGVCAWTLFSAFRAHRGQSPMALLRAQRFELARLRLLSSTAVTVGEIAFSCGFEHLGRFSTGYRKRFGETPTQTMRRGRSQSA